MPLQEHHQIISVDDHLIEPPTVWTDRITGPDAQDAPRIITSEQGSDYVCGLIVKNPFFDRPLPIEKLESRNSPLAFLTNNEFLLCAMPQWHNVNAPECEYELVSVEGSWIESVPALYVRCDWR